MLIEMLEKMLKEMLEEMSEEKSVTTRQHNVCVKEQF
jgi:hypothetical protein